MARKSISKKTRFEVFKRDGFACQYCGAHPPAVVLVLDHIVPVAAGGVSDDTNLVTSCEPCNQGKSARSLTQVPVSLADRAAAVSEREAQLLGFNSVMESQRLRIESDVWDVVEIFTNSTEGGIRKDWFRSIRNFNEKLGKFEVMDAMEIAVSRHRSEGSRFRYFCGICWSKIREIAAKSS